MTEQLRDCKVNIAGIASIFWLVFQPELPRSASAINSAGIAHYNRIHEKVLNRGIYFPPSGYEVCFISAAHPENMLSSVANTLAGIIRQEAHSWH